MGSAQTVGSYQVALTAEAVAQKIEPESSEAFKELSQMGSVLIRALKGNTGIIYLGDSDVAAANGYELAAGDSVAMDIQGLGGMWFNGTKTGDKLCILFTGP